MYKLEKDRFIDRLEKEVFFLLQPHDIRSKAYDKYIESNPA